MLFRALFMGIGCWLIPFASQAVNYTTLIEPQASVDQADVAIINTIAWHLNQVAAAGGGTLYLAAGDYWLTESVVIPDHTTIIGSKLGTRLIAYGEAFNDHLFNNVHSDHPQADGVHDITLRNL